MSNTHYAPAFNPKYDIKDLGMLLLQTIEGGMAGTAYPVLAFRGMSGTVTATRLSEWLTKNSVEHGMVYVRKEHEESHGRGVEASLDDSLAPNAVLVFVDDFVCLGDTRDKTLDAAEAYLYDRGGPWAFDFRVYQALTGSAGGSPTVTERPRIASE